MANPLSAARAAKAARRVKKIDKKPSTPAQRAFGGGRQIGKKVGRKQGAAAGLAAGITVSEIRNMKSKSNLKKMMEAENLTLAQKNAIQETLLKLASEEMKNTRTVPRNSQSPKPKLRPQEKAKGGAIKLKAGGSPEPAWLKAMKKEADKLGVPLRELLTMHNGRGGPTTRDKYGPQKPKAKGKKASMMRAAKGGYSKKK